MEESWSEKMCYCSLELINSARKEDIVLLMQCKQEWLINCDNLWRRGHTSQHHDDCCRCGSYGPLFIDVNCSSKEVLLHKIRISGLTLWLRCFTKK